MAKSPGAFKSRQLLKMITSQTRKSPCARAGEWLVGGVAILWWWHAVVGAEPPVLTEFEVKAGFVYNFAKFVEWPATAFSGLNAPVVVGVLSEDTFATLLEQTLKGKAIQGRPCLIKKFNDLKGLGGCHLLFIGGSEKKRLPEILASLKGAPLLTVSDMERFAQLGVVINLFKEQNSLRFEINVDAAARAQLRINPKLLQLARIVHDLKP